MAIDFNKFAAQGTNFMQVLAKDLGYPEDTDRAGRVLRAVLHAFRNRLTTEESVQLLAQLPMFLKAVYVENWTLYKGKKRIKHIEEFYREIRKADKQAAHHDFATDEAIDNALAVVFQALRKYVSLGELEDIKSVLPKELKFIVNQVTMI